ncbi:MAG: TolC family protein, partial [Opitutaceae bacterium]|nr:TolC family protein [Opitutaceae bacterium]
MLKFQISKKPAAAAQVGQASRLPPGGKAAAPYGVRRVLAAFDGATSRAAPTSAAGANLSTPSGGAINRPVKSGDTSPHSINTPANIRAAAPLKFRPLKFGIFLGLSGFLLRSEGILEFGISAAATTTASSSAPAPAPASAPPAVPDQLDLETALRFALEHNFQILQARERIREQEGLIVEIKARVLPRAAVGAGYGITDKTLAADTTGAPGDRHDWQIGLTVSQLLYSGGGVSAALSAQKSTREAALLGLEAVINDALLAVRTRFYDVLLAREQIKVQEQNIQLLEEQRTIAKNRFDAGASSSFEVLRAEVAIANARPDLIRARNGRRTAIDRLRQSLGYANPGAAGPERAPGFIGDLAAISRVTCELQAALDAARSNRPEIKQLLVLEKAHESGVKAARAGRQPEVSLAGGYTYRKDNRSRPDGLGDPLDGWNIGVQANWPVFDGRATAGRVAQARSQHAQARLRTADTTLAIEVEVRQAWSSLQEAAELVDAARKVIEQAEEALRQADSRYAAGAATQLDVLTSRLSLTESRLNQLHANYSYNVAVAALRKATGQADPF